MKLIYLTKIICFLYLINTSEQLSKNKESGAEVGAENITDNGATRKVIANTIKNSRANNAAALTDANNAIVAGKTLVKTKTLKENIRILDEADRKAAADLSTLAKVAAAQVQMDSNAVLEDIKRAVSQITAVIHKTGGKLVADSSDLNTQMKDTVKTTTSKVLGDLDATLVSVQAAIDEEVTGINAIVDDVVACTLRDINECTSIIAASTRAALAATKNSVTTAALRVAVDVSAADKEVSKDVEAEKTNIKKSLLTMAGSLRGDATLVGGSIDI